jgi:hypothetical protein
MLEYGVACLFQPLKNSRQGCCHEKLTQLVSVLKQTEFIFSLPMGTANNIKVSLFGLD